MKTEKMPEWLVERVCDELSYIPTRNVVGLTNRSAYFLFDNWTPNSVCAHSLVPDPKGLTRGFLRDCFRYAFANVDWLIGVTPGDNEKALLFNKRLGFSVRDVLPQGFAKGVDTVYQVMHYRSCRWWKRDESLVRDGRSE